MNFVYKKSNNLWVVSADCQFISFTCERCNMSSVKKRFTWVVATFQKEITELRLVLNEISETKVRNTKTSLGP